MSATLNATVKYPCKEVETRFGKRVNVVLVTDSGEQITQWGNPDDAKLYALKRNQKVTLVKDDKNKFTLMDSVTPEPAKTSSYKPENWDNDVKNRLTAKATDLITFYESCDALVRKTVKEYKTEESLRSITTTIFLQSIRNV
ncbi:MAG TPA: hypothetical protein P5556_02280 [Candidatus Gastranaerophilales bacterium]|nr:hypothetical protein [Candidatus Gastranaerophilales bacterium]